MIVFVGAVRHPLNANDYARVERLLLATLRSLCRQTDGDFRVIVVCNRAPDFDDPEIARRVEYLEVDFPPPSLLCSPVTRMAAIRRDKSTKYVRGIIAAQQHRPDYVMIFDTDDYVSPKVTKFANGFIGRANGWHLDRGYVFDCRDDRTYLISRFHLVCGTSLIINNGLLAAPVTQGTRVIRIPSGESATIDLSRTDFCGALNERASQDEILATIDGVFLSYIIGSHRWAARYYQLEPLPFPGAIWTWNTGENHGGERRAGDSWQAVNLEACSPPSWMPR